VLSAIDARVHLVEMAPGPGTGSGFSVSQSFGEEGSELDAPFAEDLVTDLDVALMEQLLDVPVTERKTVVEPYGVLDDCHWGSVAIGFRVSHSRSAYLDPG